MNHYNFFRAYQLQLLNQHMYYLHSFLQDFLINEALNMMNNRVNI